MGEAGGMKQRAQSEVQLYTSTHLLDLLLTCLKQMYNRSLAHNKKLLFVSYFHIFVHVASKAIQYISENT